MKRSRAHVNDDAPDAIGAGQGLRVVSRVAPPRPRWGRLYLTLGTVAVIGAAVHGAVNAPVLLRIMDAVLALVLFATLAGWVHRNRMALTRLGEPDAGAGPPRVRIVRSRHVVEEADTDEPGERVILPYDFR